MVVGRRVRLLVGTKRGLFLYTSDERRATWQAHGPLLVGREVYSTRLDPRTGAIWACTTHSVWGTHIHCSTDGGETWEILNDAPHYDDERGVAAVWEVIGGPASQPNRLYAGIEPAGLFVSDDRGQSWASVDALNEHPAARSWQPAGGALALHSIHVHPHDDKRAICAVSAGGVYRTLDGVTWQPANAGTRAEFLPTRYPDAGQCVHRLLVHPQRPERVYQQNHNGVYVSDDFGGSWREITEGLPSDFGYALALDPNDPAAAYVIPEESSHMRATIDGRLRVYRTRDAGATWEALTRGLPQENAYVSILREGMTSDALDPCGVYFGTSSGHLFASATAGDDWQLVAGFLPRIISVSAVLL